ncbi:MAG: uracil-DNA glycosylase family protein [Myxococcota bacterium]
MSPVHPIAAAAAELSKHLNTLHFGPPTACVYDPLQYAFASFARYAELYGSGEGRVLLVGMNPGPWGMAQTGVPFGEVAAVRDWLGIRDVPIGKPAVEHPKRPIQGLACPRSEVSGARVWGWAQQRFGTPEAFFAQFFVANYCPLCFMVDSGANLTPDKLPRVEREPLFAACDRALRQSVELLRPSRVVGVGRFAEERARVALQGLDVPIGQVLHPSPASPLANRGWADEVTAQLRAMGVRATRASG